ncbi:MAG: hypothetical protein NTX25_05335, partial [Proteobacteria bacterium]|nr:hypothetical protein [Pseudomonadota bacterium]
GCPETEIDNLINFNLANPDPARVFAGDNPETKRAFRIDNPEVTSFASASCVACHKASRKTGSLSTENALDGTSEYSRIRAKSPQAFKIPSGVSTTKAKDESSFSGGAWAIRAFGWGETGTDPDISGYTLNDSMRVASELNELIRQGKLK